MQNRPGKFIVIEGIDGAGKSTLARALARELEARGAQVCLTREPTDGPYGRRIRELARAGREGVTAREETDLFIADRREHLRDVVEPALRAGKTVIQDRYYYSTMAYQGARGADALDILARHREFAPEPDLLILLRLPVERSLERIEKSRGDAPDHFEREEYLREVARNFEKVERPNLLKLDAERPEEELREAAMRAIVDLRGGGGGGRV